MARSQVAGARIQRIATSPLIREGLMDASEPLHNAAEVGGNGDKIGGIRDGVTQQWF